LLTKRRRRSGVSSVIGAIFFILVVFLVFSATVLVFQSFSNYSLVVKQVNSQDAQNKVTDAGISALAFGGLPSPPVVTCPGGTQIAGACETMTATLNNLSPTRSLLPISNMNLSNSMNGWVFSRAYKIVRDNGYITNAYLNIIPGGTVFKLNVTNADPSGSCIALTSCITRVSLQVDSRFSLVGFTGIIISDAPAPWIATISGNTITWTTSSANGIAPGAAPVQFTWAALAPGVPGSYFQTATLTWLTVFNAVPISDQGSATLTTQVVTGGPGGISIPPYCNQPTDTLSICAEPVSVIPGGAAGGFDSVTGVGSESGPGSVYVAFQPTYNGAIITQGQQLSAVMNFTSVFTIDAGQVGALASGAADAVNFGFSLDQIVAPPNPLILIDEYLVQLTPTGATNVVIQIPNTTPIVPTQINNFASSGWITCGPSSTICPEPYFNPVTLASAQGQPLWKWASGNYELVISVTASMPSASPPSANYPSSLLMHFDDIGLALQDLPTTYFVDNAAVGQTCTNASPPPATELCSALYPTSGLLQIPFAAVPSQLQSIQLTTTISLSQVASQNVTAYVFLGDVSRGTATPVWVEVGQLELSSSATLSVNIPASSASNFIDTTGSICGSALPHPNPGLCVRVYAISDGNKGLSYNFGSLAATATAVLQTFNYNSVTLTLFNNSTVPIGFTTLYISGPDGVSSYNLTPGCTASPLVTPGSVTPCYINQGQEIILSMSPSSVPPAPFVWKTDQTYVATVVTNKGLSFSETFVSP